MGRVVTIRCPHESFESMCNILDCCNEKIHRVCAWRGMDIKVAVPRKRML